MDLRALVRVEDAEFFMNDPFPIYAEMRRTAPVFRYEPLQAWILTRHADVRFVSRTPGVFSSASGVFLQDARHGMNLATQLFPPGSEQITFTDPPRHGDLRRVISPAFVSAAIERAIVRLDKLCIRALDQIIPGVVIDWAATAARSLPVDLASALLGLSIDCEDVLFWSDELERVSDPNMTVDVAADGAEQLEAIEAYLRSEFAAKVGAPGDDLLTMLLEAQDRGELSEVNALMFAQTVLLGSNDSVGSLIAGMVYHLADNPDQLRLLAEDPSLIPATIEETLRYASPDRGFMRRVTADVMIGEQPVRAGEYVYMAYDAANRDDAVFDNPEVFDITAVRPTANLAFGFGIHACVAQQLVRAFGAQFLERLLERYPHFVLAGDPVRKESLSRHAWLHMPVVFDRPAASGRSY